jgi:Domain of unknown function (DUF1942)
MSDTTTTQTDSPTPTTPTTPRRRKGLKITLATAGGFAVLFTGIAIGAAGHGTTMTAATPPPPATSAPAQPATSAPAQPAPAAPEISHYNAPIGSTLTATDDSEGAKWTVRVNSVRPYHDEYSTPPAGTHLVAVNVTYTALQGKASPNTFDWNSKTASGQTYESQVGGDSSLSSNDIEAGQKTTGDVILAVPNGGTATAVYSAGLSESGSWKIA